MTTDYERRVHRVELTDGVEHEQPFSERMSALAIDVRRVSFAVAERELTVTLPAGDDVVIEIGGPGDDLSPPGRPVVYLDQNYWVLLSQARWAPQKIVRPSDREAATTLIRLADERAILLPLAAAHLTEAPTGGPRRRHVVITMLSLSRGWQMRSPLHLRRRELRAALAGEEIPAQGVFTLEPEALFATPPGPVKTPSDFPADAQELHRRLTAVSAFCSALIEDEPRSPEGRRLAQKWASGHHRLAEFMGQRRMGPEHSRINALACMLADLERELTTVASELNLDQERFSEWLEDTFERELARLPYLGRVYELVYRRLRDANKAWKINDLNDVQFLCCAAGYADLLVAENRTTHDLQQIAPRVPDGAILCNSLPEAVDRLATISGLG
jgi:hypothetical protein